MTLDDIESIRIVPRETHYDNKTYWAVARPFSEIFIVANGQHYFSRVFYRLDNSPHAIAAQKQDFLRRQNR